MISQPDRWFLAADFCGRDYQLPFVGYKAPTRISEMQKKGILVSRWSSMVTALGSRLKEYKISNDFEVDFFTEKGKEKIEMKEIPAEQKFISTLF
jgi:hypothetical protein